MYRLKKRYLILILIFLLGSILRFYRLVDFPVHLNHDEISQLYDAQSLAQTGRDIYGNFFPFIFPSVGDFKPPFYTYVTSLFYLILGGGELTIRLPSAIFSVLIIFAVYLFVLKLFKRWEIALLASFFTSVSPFEIFFARKSFENGAGILLMLLGFSCLLTYLEDKKQKWLFGSAIFLGIALYTYFSHAIIIPLLTFTFVILFKRYFSKKNLIALLLFIVISSPLILMILTNEDVRFRSQTVFVTQDVNLGREVEYGNKYKAIFDYSFNRYLDQFNPKYVFGNGLDLTNQGPLGMGPLLFVELPFLIFGMFYLVELSGFTGQKKFVLAWVLLGMLPSGLTFEPHSPHRVIMVLMMFNIISAAGLYAFSRRLNKSNIKFAAFAILGVAFAANFIYFIHMYAVNFPYEKSQNLHYPFKQVAQFAWSHYNEFDHIIFDPQFGEVAPTIGTAAHYYLAYYGNYPPTLFQKEYKIGQKTREILFDKFSIRKVDFLEDQNLKNTLIIASHWSLPIQSIDKEKLMHTFYFYNKQPAFYAIKL